MDNKISNQEYLKRVKAGSIENIIAIQRLSKNKDWPALMEWMACECLEDESPYETGAPTDHTLFRCGCQQPLIKLKNILKTDIDELTKERN